MTRTSPRLCHLHFSADVPLKEVSSRSFASTVGNNVVADTGIFFFFFPPSLLLSLNYLRTGTIFPPGPFPQRLQHGFVFFKKKNKKRKEINIKLNAESGGKITLPESRLSDTLRLKFENLPQGRSTPAGRGDLCQAY